VPDAHIESQLSRRMLLKGAVALAGGATASGVLAACAPAAPTATAPASTAPAAPGPTAAAPAAQARKGGSLIIASGDALVPDLAYGNAFGPQGFTALQWIWPLFRTKPASFEVLNALAEGYTPSADGLSHKITLRSGIVFHDGSPIDAAAVAANLKAAFDQKDPLRGSGAYQGITTFFGGFPGNFKSVDVNDPRTLTISLLAPRADLRGALCYIYMVNPKVLQANPQGYGTDVSLLKNAGSGPFRVADFQPGQFVEFTRFDGFFEEAYLDKLRIQNVADPSARFLSLKGGQVQVATGLSRADYEAASKDPAFRVHVSNPGGNVFMAFNATKNELLRENKDVREAIVRAMNRQAYVDAFYPKGLAQLGTQVALAPGTPGFNADVKPLPYDPDSAKALLQKAGVTSLAMTMIDPPAFGGASELKSQMEAIAADLGKVGIKVDTNLTDLAGYLAGTKDHDINVTVYGNSGNDIGVASLYFRRPPTTYQAPPDPRYAQLLQEAEVATNADAQNAKLKQLMAIASENVVGGPIAYLSVAAVSGAKVHDISMTASPLDPQHRAWIEA
jgi:peptide/nickel transport system substrate-binding protein